jgi:hypothetical protein
MKKRPSTQKSWSAILRIGSSLQALIHTQLPLSDVTLCLEAVMCGRSKMNVCYIEIQYQLVASTEIGRPNQKNVQQSLNCILLCCAILQVCRLDS